MRNLLRNLAYSAVILFCLTGTAHFLSSPARGGTADLSYIVKYGGDFVLTTDNKLWRITTIGTGPAWAESGPPYTPLPVPPNQVAHIVNDVQFVDTSGNGWKFFNAHWQNAGPVPAPLPAPTKPQSWGAIKGGAGTKAGGGN